MNIEGKTILLVEDEVAVRKLARKLLEVIGCEVIEAASGREALDRWPEIRDRVSLVVSDVVMPEGVSGWDLTRELHHRHPDLGILLTSGYSDLPSDHGLGGIPQIEFLQKPYGAGALKAPFRDSSISTRREPAGSTRSGQNNSKSIRSSPTSGFTAVSLSFFRHQRGDGFILNTSFTLTQPRISLPRRTAKRWSTFTPWPAPALKVTMPQSLS